MGTVPPDAKPREGTAGKFEALVNEKESPPFTRNEGWSERVAGVRTMGLGPRA
jgi:hypothetical protein